MAHIHTGPGEYDLTVSAFIVRAPTPSFCGAQAPSQNRDSAVEQLDSLDPSRRRFVRPQGDGGGPPRLLLHRHKTLGVVMQAGGHVELTETPWEAITHEILEETGYEMSQLKVLQPPLRMDLTGGVHPQPLSVRSFRFGDEDHFHIDLSYVFVTDQEPLHSVGEDESEELMWVTRDELASIDTYEDVRAVGYYVFDHLLGEWEAVDCPSPTV
ncbi:MAG: NUDIX domain-containing protein [Propionibacteriaceae bacterium]|nr:NUDIX domain-containing protein [Propionibacteriaceae bacterium]